MNQQLLKKIEEVGKSATMKRKIITRCIYNGSYTLPDLAKEMGLSIPTVTKTIAEMCADGYISIYGKLETSGGRYPNLYGLNPESAYFVGVDVNHTHVNIGLMNFKGDMLDLKMRIPFVFENNMESFGQLCTIITGFIKKLSPKEKEKRILNVNINLIGRVNTDTGYSFDSFNFDERPLAEMFSEKLGLPATIDNETRAMTYGEYMKGCVQGEKNIIFINVGWELSIGIVINGKVYGGKSGFSGEFGHINAYDNEIICRCGKKGCIETEVSGSAFHRILSERIANGENSILTSRMNDKNGSPITLDDIVDAVNKEDLLCIEIAEDIGHKLGKQIAGLINIFNPELVIIGGLLASTGDYMLQPLKTAVRKYSQNVINKDSDISLSKLDEKAGVVGACMLSRSRMFEIPI